MARNERRRAQLADAGLEVLANEGSRGLTHRAVDAAAGVPPGTTSNYFRSRQKLMAGLLTRIRERLEPDPTVLEELGAREPSPALFADYLRDIVARLTTNREVTLALFELRLEAARRPKIAELMGQWQREGYQGAVAFNEQAGLPGGAREIALFHYAIDGLLFDAFTTPIAPELTTDEIVDALVASIFSSG